ncbi:MAG: phosphatidate cytidylyltransferase [Limnobacter sp.]|nr:phosphatidate cytidylyltransferase [Limnobacter sp.]
MLGVFAPPRFAAGCGVLVVGGGRACTDAGPGRGAGFFCWSVLAVCWVADVFAYVFGKWLGTKKLAPRISPGKSWEGAMGGIAAVVALSWLAVWAASCWPFLRQSWQFKAFSVWHPALFTVWLIGLSAVSIVGDLFESLLKRHAGVKDSSGLLPGHGGVLDRIDAQLPVVPLAVLTLSAAGLA